MYKERRRRKIILSCLMIVVFGMVCAYGAFQSQLKISGSSTITSNWDIEITGITLSTTSGSAENVSTSYDKLNAYMEANLYSKGDSQEYDVTIENKGTLDAKLDDITTSLENANSSAVLITFSGYTKGEKLLVGKSKTVHVKIEYNPEYTGGETSSEVEVNFNYVQNDNTKEPVESTYLLTYDYSANGGTEVSLDSEYITSGVEVNLNNLAVKDGYTFVGWNTDKDATTGLTTFTMPEENTTLYAIYSKALTVTYTKGDNVSSIGKTSDSCNIYNNNTSCEITLTTITPNTNYDSYGWYNSDTLVGKQNTKYNLTSDTTLASKVGMISLSIATTKTTNSITVVANASAPSGISKYEYSKNGGNTWVTGTSNTYTFNSLKNDTSYMVKVRITTNDGNIVTSDSTSVTTSSISTPTFEESGDSEKTVTIIYPSGCGSTYTCTYTKDSESKVTVTSETATVTFTKSGSVVAKVSDGTNEVSSSYTVTIAGTQALSEILTVSKYDTGSDCGFGNYITSTSTLPIKITWYYNTTNTTDLSSATLLGTEELTLTANQAEDHYYSVPSDKKVYVFGVITDTSKLFTGNVLTCVYSTDQCYNENSGGGTIIVDPPVMIE